MSLAVSDEGLRPSARDEDLRRAEKHRLLPHCLYEILYQYTACAAVCQPRRAHFLKLFFAWSATSAVCRSGALRRFTAVCQPRALRRFTAVCQPRRAHFSKLFSLGLRHLPFVDRARCGALPPFVNRGALRRFTAVDKRERCGVAKQKRRIRPRFFAKKARARAKFGWCVLVAVRQKAALFEEARDIV